MKALRLLLPALLLPLAVSGCGARQAATVTIDPTKTHQTIDGWEVTAKVWEFNKPEDRFDGSWMPIRDQIMTALVEQGGINRMRLQIKSGAENPVDYWDQFQHGRIGYLKLKEHFYDKQNDNADPAVLNPDGIKFSEIDFHTETIVLPAMRAAQRIGRPLLVTLCYNDFAWTKLKGTLSHAKNPAEYAELISATFAHLKAKYGLVPDRLEIILEPDNSDDWRGEQIGRAILAVRERLDREGFHPVIIAPSNTAAQRVPAYFDAIAKVPGAAEQIGVVAYHRYDRIISDATLAAIRDRAKRIGAETAMLEYIPGDIDDLFDDLVKADASGWQRYAIAMKDTGGPEYPGNMLRVRDADTPRPDARLKASSLPLAQIFRNVDRGAVRIGAASDRADVQAVAFRNPDKRFVVTVKADRSSLQHQAERLKKYVDVTTLVGGPAGTVAVKGLPGGTYVRLVSNGLVEAQSRCVQTVAQGSAANLSLASGDVATLVQQAPGAKTDLPAC